MQSVNNEAILVLGIFEGHDIRQVWHDNEWYFSVVDVIAALIDCADYRAGSRYWTTLKARLIAEGFTEPKNCLQLKFAATDGKLREADSANIRTLFKIIQSIPGTRRRERKQGQDTAGNCGIYAIINSQTQEEYIGSSRDISTRIIQHRSELRRNRHHSAKLQAAWNEYGEDAFLFVLLEDVPDESDLEKTEQLYLRAKERIYNTVVNATNPGDYAIEETRMQRFIAFLREQAGISLKSGSFQQLHLLIDHRIIIPGPNYYRLTEAELAGVTTWETLQTFLLQQ